MRKHKGFTLVEILIVVVILGILAAIVIPQFSQASTEARMNSLASNLQTVRSQLSLYRVQHNDNWPTLANLALDASAPGTGSLTGKTTQAGVIDNTDGRFGPYLQSVPTNPFTGGNTVGATTASDWVYAADAVTGEMRFSAGLGGTDDIMVEVNGANVSITTF